MITDIIYWVLFGAAAGWITGRILKGKGYGIGGNILIGIAGALTGGFVSSLLNISLGEGLLARLVTAVLGAILFLVVLGYVQRSKKSR